MTPRTVWLASFPKSGNTWLRAIIAGLTTHEHLFAVNQLGSGAQPNYVTGSPGNSTSRADWQRVARKVDEEIVFTVDNRLRKSL